jgi:hypothetical protein
VIRSIIVALVLVAPVAARGAPAPAAPDDGDGFVARLFSRAIAELEAAAAAREPVLVPPVPVTVKWRARRVDSIDLNAPLLALRAGDLDGDDSAELVALTTREVVVLRRTGTRKLAVLARARLPAEPPPIRPRDPVGTLVLTGGPQPEILARASTSARGVALTFRGGALEELRKLAGFPLCVGASATLVPGRNYIAAAGVTWAEPSSAPPLAGDIYAAACERGLVDPAGRPLAVFGAVDLAGVLTVRIDTICPAADAECAAIPARESTVSGVGRAFAIADIDNDGRPDVVASSDRPRGDPDRVVVQSPRGARWKPVFDHNFSGGVAGIAAGDLNGDGAVEIACAVRLVGADRVDVWVLN